MDEHDNKGFYRLLEATPNSTPSEIKRNYRRLALRHHPDVETNPEKRRRQHDLMRNLNEAYEMLRDPGRRGRYDRECAFPRCKLHPESFLSGRCSGCSELICPRCSRSARRPYVCHPCEEKADRRRRTKDPVESALLAIEDGDLDSAGHALTRALLANPRDVVALTALSTVREKRGDLAGAACVLMLALEIKPGHAFSYYRLGLLYQRLERDSDAETALREALRLSPGNAKYQGALFALQTPAGQAQELRFRPNDCVAHTVFGRGVVLEVTPVGVRVKFGECGIRWLDPTRSPMAHTSS